MWLTLDYDKHSRRNFVCHTAGKRIGRKNNISA
jgi:hypothetical protein